MIWFRRHNISVIMVHHTNKQGSIRGSISRLDAVDLLITLSPMPDSDGTSKAEFYVDFPKHRSVFGDVIEPLAVKLREDENKKFVWEWKPKQKSSEDS